MKTRVLVAVLIATITSLSLAGIAYTLDSDTTEAASGKISVTYVVDEDCGTNSADNSTSCTTSSTLYDAVANDGYKFSGWYTKSSGLMYSSYSKVTSFSEAYSNSGSNKVTLYALWEFQVDVSYTLNGGSLADNAETAMWSNELTTPTDPIWDGHTFYKWSTGIDITKSYLSSSNGYLTLNANSGTLNCTAVWYYNVTYLETDGATNDNATTYLSTNTLTLSDAARSGYKFLGWYDSEGNKVTSVSGGDAVLTAKWKELQTCKITYECGDAVLSDYNITSYYEGQGTELPTASLSGKFFNGWLTADGDYSTRIESIDGEMTGDVTLYPWFIDINDIAGHGYVLKMTMEASQGPHSKNYTYEYTSSYYIYDEEKGFYVIRNSSEGDSTSYWTEENTSSYTYTYLGMKEYTLDGTTYLCEAYECYSSNYKETQYIWKGWIPVYIEFESVRGWTTYTGTYTLEKEIDVDTSGTYSIIGYGDAGISVSGSGEFSMGDTVTLTATVSSGTEFRGWYNASGTLLSTDLTYTFTVYQDETIYACNENDSDYTADDETDFTMPHEDGLTDIVWQVYYQSTGNVETYSGELKIRLEYGGNYSVYYSGELDGKTVYGFFTVYVDGDLARVFTWTVDGTEYSLTLCISYSDYLAYKNDDCTRDSSSYQGMMDKITSDDEYVVQVARYIMTQTSGMDQADQIMVLLSFVQNIEYMLDEESVGVEEYFKYPVETLYEQNGDCEDTSILFCSIASAMGYNSAMLLFSGHMAGSVEITDGSVSVKSPATFKLSGSSITYYYCETTATGWEVGQAPSGYTQGGRYYIYSDSKAIMPVDANYGLDEVTISDDGTATITEEDLAEAASNGNGITLRSDDFTVKLSSETVTLLSSSGSSAEFSISKVSQDDLTDAQKTAIGDNYAFTVSLTSGGTVISQLNGKATMTLAFTGNGGTISKVTVYCVAEDGSTESFEATYSSGKVVFSTTHFSTYMIVPEYGSSSDGGSSGSGSSDSGSTNSNTSGGSNDTMVIVAVAIVAVIIIAAIACYALRSKSGEHD